MHVVIVPTDARALAIDPRMLMDPTTPGTLYAGMAGAGVFKSTDGASVWRPLNAGLTNTAVTKLAIEPAAPSRLYTGTKGAGVFALEQRSSCVGDCNDDGRATVDELVSLVNIALGAADIVACPAGDANHDGSITIDEVVVGVNGVLNGCAAQALGW